MAYLLLVLGATWPLPLQAASHCWGVRYDLWGNLWLMGYFYRTLSSGTLQLTTPQIFHPEGFSVWAYGHFVLQVLTCPLLAVVGPSTAYAVLLWGSVSGSALSLYLLARDQVQSRWAAFVAGGLFAFHGLTYAELAVGSVEQAATFGLPAFLLCFLRWREHGGWRWGALTYMTIMLTAVCNWFFGIALAAFVVLYVLFHLIRQHDGARRVDWQLVGKALLLALLCRLSVEPFFARVVPQILARPAMSVEALQSAEANAEEDDLPALLSHVNGETVDGSALRQTLKDSLPLDRLLAEDLTWLPRLAGPGFCVVVLGAIGVALGGKRTRFWLFAFVSLTLISMGPLLRLSDTEPPTAVVLPYYPIYNAVPIFRVAYRPYRFQTAALLAGCVLAAFGVAAIMRRIPRRRTQALIALSILTAALFVRWMLCTPNRTPLLSDARLPAVYTDIANESGDFAIVEIPLHHWAFGSSNARFQYYQSVHGKAMLNNSMFINMQQLLRLRDLAQRHPLIMTLSEGPYARHVVPSERTPDDVQWMRDHDFRYIVVHTVFPRDVHHITGYQEGKEMVSEALIDFLTSLFGPPRETPDALLFDVRKARAPQASGVVTTLDFPQDFERYRHPVQLTPERPLIWSLTDRTGQPLQARSIAFWALGEQGSELLEVRLTALEAHGQEKQLSLRVRVSADQWKRFSITPEALHLDRLPPLKEIAFQTVDEKAAQINLSHVQVLTDAAPDPSGSEQPMKLRHVWSQ